MFHHQDTLQRLNENLPVGEKLNSVHTAIKDQFPFIDRIAVAIYDPKTDLLKTYVHSSGGESPLKHYQAKLTESASLQEIIELRKPRVVNDLSIFADSSKPHAKGIKQKGYASSYTLPMYLNDTFFGFVFFNSMQKDAFP